MASAKRDVTHARAWEATTTSTSSSANFPFDAEVAAAKHAAAPHKPISASDTAEARSTTSATRERHFSFVVDEPEIEVV